MAAAYKLLICGAQPGHTQEQVASALAPILKRAPEQRPRLLGRKAQPARPL